MSPDIKIKSAIFNLRAAYYYLNRSGEDHFGRDYNYVLSIEGDKVTNSSHRVSGDMFLRAYEKGEFGFDVGVRANYYTDDREEDYDYFLSNYGFSADDGYPDLRGYNQMGKTRSYVFPYLRFTVDKVIAEVGGGPSDGSRKYNTTCADICDTGEPNEETEINAYFKLGFTWGGE